MLAITNLNDFFGSFILVASLICIPSFFSSRLVAQEAETESATVTLSTPEIIKAGETVRFTVTLDRAPNFNGASLFYSISGPNFAFGGVVPLSTKIRTYQIAFPVPAAAQGGTWSLIRLEFYPGALKPRTSLKNFKPVSFRVVANSNLIFPTSVEVTINPSQVQLLRREAVAVQTRIQDLKANLIQLPKSPDRGKLIAILQKNLSEALEAINSTERSFTERGSDLSVLDAAEVFFDDLRTSYREMIRDLPRARTDIAKDHPFITAALVDQPSYPALAQGPLRILEQNELAYTVVANNEHLTFDLEVNSFPAGATVFYRRRADSERQNGKPTDSTIPSLPYAIWTVRFHLDGYKDEEREHDPFREPNHVVTVKLAKK